MPIRPENRKRYPADWREISRRIRFDRAAGQCECDGICGRPHLGGRCAASHGAKHPETGSVVVLTTAHLDHVPENCEDGNLRAMCQRCHNAYDAPMRREGSRRRAHEARAAGDLFGGA